MEKHNQNSKRKYVVWETDSQCEPVEGKEETVTSTSMRDFLEQRAFVMGVPYHRPDRHLKLPNGNRIFVSFLK